MAARPAVSPGLEALQHAARRRAADRLLGQRDAPRLFVVRDLHRPLDAGRAEGPHLDEQPGPLPGRNLLSEPVFHRRPRRREGWRDDGPAGRGKRRLADPLRGLRAGLLGHAVPLRRHLPPVRRSPRAGVAAGRHDGRRGCERRHRQPLSPRSSPARSPGSRSPLCPRHHGRRSVAAARSRTTSRAPARLGARRRNRPTAGHPPPTRGRCLRLADGRRDSDDARGPRQTARQRRPHHTATARQPLERGDAGRRHRRTPRHNPGNAVAARGDGGQRLGVAGPRVSHRCLRGARPVRPRSSSGPSLCRRGT